MLTDFNLLFWRHNIHPRGIFHIGSSDDAKETPYYEKFCNGPIVYVEALPKLCARLKEKLKPFPRHVALCACISDEDGKAVRFHVASNGAQSSSILPFGTHSERHPEVKFIADVDMVTTRADTLLAKNFITFESPSFLSIDIQGAELLALRSMETLLPAFDWIYCEVNKAPLYVGCPMVEDIDAFLAPHGFERAETWWHGNDGWGDCLQVRRKGDLP